MGNLKTVFIKNYNQIILKRVKLPVHIRVEYKEIISE